MVRGRGDLNETSDLFLQTTVINDHLSHLNSLIVYTRIMYSTIS